LFSLWAGFTAFITGEQMKISHRLSVSAVAVGLAAGLSYTSIQAAHHQDSPDQDGHDQDSVGEYITRGRESQLFLDGGTRLGCDLFFSMPDGRTALAKKDSLVTQQVPAFVWQFSGLLPVSDFLKTVAIHSAATDEKSERWQDVQHTYYNGLRAEGVAEADAKIAFAGAYAFAPRWPLIELVEIPDIKNIPHTKLYTVAVTDPARKGLSIDDYRAMARDILDSPENVTLQDIRGVVDAVDAGQDGYEETSLLVGLMNKLKGAEQSGIVAEPEIGAAGSASDTKSGSDGTGSDEWVHLPDGTAVLENVESLGKG
jgi:hypothetical protein